MSKRREINPEGWFFLQILIALILIIGGFLLLGDLSKDFDEIAFLKGVALISFIICAILFFLGKAKKRIGG